MEVNFIEFVNLYDSLSNDLRNRLYNNKFVNNKSTFSIDNEGNIVDIYLKDLYETKFKIDFKYSDNERERYLKKIECNKIKILDSLDKIFNKKVKRYRINSDERFAYIYRIQTIYDKLPYMKTLSDELEYCYNTPYIFNNVEEDYKYMNFEDDVIKKLDRLNYKLLNGAYSDVLINIINDNLIEKYLELDIEELNKEFEFNLNKEMFFNELNEKDLRIKLSKIINLIDKSLK